MITIKKSETADTRSCDWSKVTKEQLKESSRQHIIDVEEALRFFRHKLMQAGTLHDYDKISYLDHFHSDFVTGFKETGWWDNHRKINRHHLLQEDGVREDVNLIDVLEFIADCVMAGMARTGSVYPLEISPDLLARAFQNTVGLLKAQVVVAEESVRSSTDGGGRNPFYEGLFPGESETDRDERIKAAKLAESV